jgi:hypothetical protein
MVKIARIAKTQAETGKFAVEQRKLAADASKFRVERFTIALAELVNVLSGAAGGAIGPTYSRTDRNRHHG